MDVCLGYNFENDMFSLNLHLHIVIFYICSRGSLCFKNFCIHVFFLFAFGY